MSRFAELASIYAYKKHEQHTDNGPDCEKRLSDYTTIKLQQNGYLIATMPPSDMSERQNDMACHNKRHPRQNDMACHNKRHPSSAKRDIYAKPTASREAAQLWGPGLQASPTVPRSGTYTSNISTAVGMNKSRFAEPCSRAPTHLPTAAPLPRLAVGFA